MPSSSDTWDTLKAIAPIAVAVTAFIVIMSAPDEWCARTVRNRWTLLEAQLIDGGSGAFLFIHGRSIAHYRETPLERLTTLDLDSGRVLANTITKHRISLLGATDTSLLVSEGGLTFMGSKGSKEYAVSLPGLEKLYSLDDLLASHGDVLRRSHRIRLEKYTGHVWFECADSEWYAFDIPHDSLYRLSSEHIRAMHDVDWGISYEQRIDQTTLTISGDGSTMQVDTSFYRQRPKVTVGKAHFDKPKTCGTDVLPPRLIGDTLLNERRFLCDNTIGHHVAFNNGDRCVVYQDIQGLMGKTLLGRLDSGGRCVWRVHERTWFGPRARKKPGHRIAWSTLWQGRLVIIVVIGEGGNDMYVMSLNPENGAVQWLTTLQ